VLKLFDSSEHPVNDRVYVPFVNANKSTLFDAISNVLDQHGRSVSCESGSMQKIPEMGRLIILANDPLSGLSALALINLCLQVRDDIKVIADASSPWLESVSDLLLNPLERRDCQEDVSAAATQHLANEGVLIIQPVHFGQARGVPKLTQERWPTDFLNLAEHTLSPLLHVHVSSDEQPLIQQARFLYRGDSLLRRVAQKVLPHAYDLKLTPGELIAAEDFKRLKLRDKFKAKLLRKQLYRFASGKSSYFKTMPGIAPPESRSDLLQELKNAELLGKTKDQKLIYLCSLTDESALLREIGRLREQAFRLVGEGSGKARDVDAFDEDYQHIVLWDEGDKEVVGAYRLRPTFDIKADKLYTSTLMTYQANATQTLQRGVELGRSFVQPRYWGSRSLDYLWVGIAAYLRRNPRVRYLLGAVSISDAFSQQAKDLLLGYYSKYYQAPEPIIQCKRPYIMAYEAKSRNAELFRDISAKEAFVVLREQLGLVGHSVPTLYKQYTELCDEQGAVFHGFNIDPDFQDCIDGLVVVDLSKLKPLKRKRYELEAHDFLAYEERAGDAGAEPVGEQSVGEQSVGEQQAGEE